MKDDFCYVRELVRREAAIVLDESKAYLIEARLSPVARQAGLESIAQLVEQLKRGASSLHTAVIEAMTTNETSFFRDVHPFEALATTVLPDLVDRRRATRAVRIWSAACSTGQEPYTIAMVVRDRVPALAGYSVEIRATDLSEGVLAQAREGRYAQLEVNRGLPAALLMRHLHREGTAWRVKPELRAMIEFAKLNLISNWPPAGTFDVIFMRNVLIYFDLETKTMLLDRVRKALAADGYLFLGAAEMLSGVHKGFATERDGRAMWHRPAELGRNE
jgi:chemotaxis protein methyltransferase CheR